MRALYIVLLNLSIPFLLFYLRNIIYKIYYVYVLKNEQKEIPELDWNKTLKLLFAGLLLLSVFLIYKRLKIKTEIRIPTYKVKQYNFRGH